MANSSELLPMASREVMPNGADLAEASRAEAMAAGADVALEAPRAAVGVRALIDRLELSLRAALARPRAMAFIVVLGLVAVSTSLGAGFGADDHIHRLSLSGSTAIRGLQRHPLDLFRFASPEFNRPLMDRGVFPWWADPQARLGFFRPVTSLTHAIDHALWPNSAALAHAQSLFWVALGLLGLAALYRRLIAPPWVAALSLLLYAIDDARAGPITWLANRNALVAFAFSIWALVAYVRQRREDWKLGAVLGPLALLFGLLSAEGAIAIFAFLVAYALFMDDARPARRVLSLVPYAVVVVGWRIASRALGYGTFGSGVYVDPVAEPIAFVAQLLERLPILLLGQLAGPWSEVYNAASLLLPGLGLALILLGVAVIGGVAWLIRPLLAKEPSLRFWATAAVLAAIPPCATFPADRLLGWVSIGAAPVIAILLAHLLDSRRASAAGVLASPLWRPSIATFAIVGLVGLHLVMAPLILPWRVTGIAHVREMLQRADRSVPKAPEITTQTFVYVNPPADPLASYIPIMRADAGEPIPHAQRWLATGSSDVELERIDARTLRVKPVDGFLTSPSEQMLRSPRRPLKVGDVVELEGFRTRITALTADGRPAEIIAEFDRPLEDATLRWFKWENAGYVAFTPPAIGARAVVPKVDYFKVAYGD